MQKWEYITIRQTSTMGMTGLSGGVYYILPNGEEKKYSGADLDGKNIHTLLNSFGSNGYELVEAATASSSAGIFVRYWVLKRPKPEE